MKIDTWLLLFVFDLIYAMHGGRRGLPFSLDFPHIYNLMGALSNPEIMNFCAINRNVIL